jgi:hypothetical protein
MEKQRISKKPALSGSISSLRSSIATPHGLAPQNVGITTLEPTEDCMKNNETTCWHSRAPRFVPQLNPKKSATGPEFHNSTELSVGTLRRKLEAEKRRRMRKERRRARRQGVASGDPTPERPLE